MADSRPQEDHAPIVAPVELERIEDGAVSHSLAILARVYHYNHWIFESIRDYLRPSVVEVGAGVGNITQFLLNLDRVVCLEPCEPYYRFLVERFHKHLNVEVRRCAIEDCPSADVPAGQFDSAICLNVLEHIADDVESLRRIRRLLRPGGNAIVLAPALPWIYGEMDRAMGHYRRYTMGSLRRAFVEAGLKPRFGRYMNMVGAPAWWWRGCVRKKARIPESATRLFDRLVPFISAAEKLLPILFGQTVFLVGEA